MMKRTAAAGVDFVPHTTGHQQVRRLYYHSNHLGVAYEKGDVEERVMVKSKEEANLISSETDASSTAFPTHMPTLDIDMPCHLKESETPGHFHLLIDRPMSWTQYVKLLSVLEEVGIISTGYYNASIERGATFLALKPWKNVEERKA